MKNAPPSRSKRPMRRCFIIVFAVMALGAWPAGARAADDTHWLTPSRRAVNSGTLFESGVAAQANSAATRDTAGLVNEGLVLYDVHCSTCHGTDLKGSAGAPPLLQAGGAAVDFYLTTGRMPLALRATETGEDNSPLERGSASGVQAYHVPPLFDARQTAAIDAFVDAHAQRRTPIPAVQLDASRLQAGRRLFENNCQACHGAAAQGATAGEQWVALPLNQATPTQIGEAIRVGPGIMPRFTPGQLSDEDISAIATYVRYLATEPQTYGGAVMGYLGPISEGAVSALIGVGFLFWVIYFTGTKADGRRVNELDPNEFSEYQARPRER
jgi:ubiquinol-cytochrome c reductase cytochrome c subunit